eukprot:4106962-Amphidinium_carterae.2
MFRFRNEYTPGKKASVADKGAKNIELQTLSKKRAVPNEGVLYPHAVQLCRPSGHRALDSSHALLRVGTRRVPLNSAFTWTERVFLYTTRIVEGWDSQTGLPMKGLRFNSHVGNLWIAEIMSPACVSQRTSSHNIVSPRSLEVSTFGILIAASERTTCSCQ